MRFAVWEDGEPSTSGLRKNVKANMFRLIWLREPKQVKNV